MCLESIMRSLMRYLAFRMTYSLLRILSLLSLLFNPLDLRWGQPNYEPQAFFSGQAAC